MWGGFRWWGVFVVRDPSRITHLAGLPVCLFCSSVSHQAGVLIGELLVERETGHNPRPSGTAPEGRLWLIHYLSTLPYSPPGIQSGYCVPTPSLLSHYCAVSPESSTVVYIECRSSSFQQGYGVASERLLKGRQLHRR